MKGKVKRDFIYCEVFAEHEKDPMDTCLHTGDEIEVIRDFTEYDEQTYLCMIVDDGCLAYTLPLPMEDIELIEEEIDNLKPGTNVILGFWDHNKTHVGYALFEAENDNIIESYYATSKEVAMKTARDYANERGWIITKEEEE